MAANSIQTSEEYPEITLTGIVVADQWSNTGAVLSYAFQADDEKKYVVMPTDIADLEVWTRKRVEVRGILHSNGQIEIFHIKEQFSSYE